jgi:RNA polymerase sigma-70 factor (ECF subfamily)
MPTTLDNRPPRMTALAGVNSADDRYRAWYEAHGGAIYRYVRFHVGSADEAEDLMADVFFRVFEARDRYDPARADAVVWIFGIARNVLRDHQRRQAVRKHVSIGDLRDLICSAPSPEERLMQEERSARLLAATAQLPAAERELLALKYSSDMSGAEIGQVLGIKEAAVRTRLWRVLGRLRTLLDVEARG